MFVITTDVIRTASTKLPQMNTMQKDLNREFLITYYKDMVDEIGEIFELFLQEMPADISLIKESFALDQQQDSAQLLHKVAPCFYNIGLPNLTDKVKEIEANIHEGNFNDAKTMFEDFEMELKEYMPAIEQECERLKAN